MQRNLVSTSSVGIQPSTHRNGFSRSVGLYALLALIAAPPVLAQTPAPDNYAVIEVDQDKAIRISSLNRSYPDQAVGEYNFRDSDGYIKTRAAMGVVDESRASRNELSTLAGYDLRPRANAADASLSVGHCVYATMNSFSSRAVAWDGNIAVDLSVITAQQLGYPMRYSRAQDVQGNFIVGVGDSHPADDSVHAFLWEKTPWGYRVIDLHRLGNLDATLLQPASSFALGVSGNVVVGQADQRAYRFTIGATGAVTTTNLHPEALVGSVTNGRAYPEQGSRAEDVDGNIIVGSGAGYRTGRKTSYFESYFRHAIRWQGTSPLDLHQAANLNVVAGTGAESYATGVAGDVIVGAGSGANYGLYTPTPPGQNPLYNTHALRWTVTNNTASLHDLHQHLPRKAINSTVAGEGYAPYNKLGADNSGDAVGVDGTIAGEYNYTDSYGYIVRRSVYWKPLLTDATGAYNLSVPASATTYLSRPFVQTAGTINLFGTLDLVSGLNGSVPYTLTGGILKGGGTMRGTLQNTGGTLTPAQINPAPTGPILIPSPLPFRIQGNYSQGTSGNLGILLSERGVGFLKISGNAAFGGNLVVSLGRGITLTYGTKVTFAEVSGTIAPGKGGKFFDTVSPGWTVVSEKANILAPTRLSLIYTGGKPPRPLP
ncbi:MAG: hypothetical protein H8F28_23025 [Fibrella sp.]|nr:hypothetical protein [Armatimonadota bacterium]